MSDLKKTPKRKKKEPIPCPNPLFAQWLVEWKNEAADRELKTQYTYSKALYSLRKYPLPLYSGKECKLLEGFGDKLCSMIDNKLAKHMSEIGTDLSVREFLDDFRVSAALDGTPPVKSRKLNESNGRKGRGKSVEPDPTKRRRSASTREYIPVKNSGAYAILLTLYEHDKECTNGESFMTKKAIMKQGQPLSEKSFTIPDPGSRYTAWSSMGTLLKKELVSRQSCPAKYTITQSGRDLAYRMTNPGSNLPPSIVSTDEPLCNRIPLPAVQKVARKKSNAGSTKVASKKLSTGLTRSKSSDSPLDGCDVDGVDGEIQQIYSAEPEDEEDLLPQLPVVPVQSVELENLEEMNSGFHFVYVDENDREVVNKDQASITIDDEISVGFLVKAKYEDLLMSGKRYKLDMSKSCAADYVYAYLHNDDAPERAAPERVAPERVAPERVAPERVAHCTSIPSVSGTVQANASKPLNLNEQNKEIKMPREIHAPAKIQKLGAAKMPKSKSMPAATITSVGMMDMGRSSDKIEASNVPSISKDTSTRYTFPSSKSDIKSLSGDSQQTDTQEEIGEPDYVLVPGSFDIVLCVDNREYNKGTTYNEEMLIKELDKNSVPYRIRPLHIGDFLWIAQDRSGAVDRRGKPIEVVLDYIVERKRMDDLASSIVDGRFKEQKFRLKSCGLMNLIYLVEEYGSMQHFSIPEQSLNQAIINTQVIDEFFVKRTRSTKDAALYLTLMTRYLHSMYSRKYLHGYEKHFKTKEVNDQFQDIEVKLMAYDVFNDASMKTKALTVSEMFGKHLMQINGVTAEKVTAILQHYPTPLSLYNAYRWCSSEKERQEMLVNLKFGATKRNVGLQISKLVAMLYFTDGPLP